MQPYANTKVKQERDDEVRGLNSFQPYKSKYALVKAGEEDRLS